MHLIIKEIYKTLVVSRIVQYNPDPPKNKSDTHQLRRVPLQQTSPGSDLLSHPVSQAVPSAQYGLTSLFGMGRGVTRTLLPPRKILRNLFFRTVSYQLTD